jgi:hypothetical protein
VPSARGGLPAQRLGFALAKLVGAREPTKIACHLALVSHPDAITNLILEALAI